MHYRHFNGGTGAQERHYTIFDQPFLLPSYEEVISPSAILGERLQSEDVASDPTLHPPCSLPPPCSPTEVCSSFEVDMPTGFRSNSLDSSVDTSDYPTVFSSIFS